MATKNNRDVKMTLSVETLGSDEIKKLQSSVAALAKEGGDAAPEFEKLADEIGRLGEQSAALQAFQQLAQSTDELVDKQTQAATRSEELRSALGEVAQATARAAQAQAEASQNYTDAQKRKAELVGELAKLRAEYDANGKKTDEYKSKLGALVDEQTKVSQSVVDLANERRKANSELKEAEAAEAKLQKQYDSSIQKNKELGNAVAEKQRALDEQRQATEQLGLSTEDLAQSQGKLLQELNRAGQEALTYRATLDSVAAAERELDALNEEVAQSLAQRNRIAQQTYAEAEAQRERDLAAEKAAQREKVEALNAYLQLRQQEIARRKQLAQEAAAAEIQAEKEAAAQREAVARDAAQKIANAFDQVGGKSAEGLRLQIQEVRTAMQTLSTQAGLTGGELQAAMNAGNARIKELERDLRAATNQLTLADKAAGLFANSLGQITAGNLIADAVGYLVEQVKDMGREFIQANLEMERLTRTMTVLTGSSEAAGQKIEFLRNVANTAGLAVGGVTDSFIRFNAAATSSGMAAEEVDSIFQAVTVNGSKMGMTTDRVALALDALGQIASKGTVSMEELRQQLGDSLPGAFAITAKGLGVTNAKLVELVESGNLTAQQFFPAFRKGLEETFGSSEKTVDGLFQAFNRLRNAFRELYQEASESSAFKALADTMDFLAANLRTVVDVTYGLGKALLALKLVDYVKGMLDFGTAAQKSAVDIAKKTTAVVADTAATTTNTAVTTANTAATTANTAAKSANAQAWASIGTFIGQSSAAATTATSGFSAMGTVLGTVTAAVGLLGSAFRSVFTLLGGWPMLLTTLVVNMKDIGTWVGETAAKMMGWGKVLVENEKQLAAQAAAEKQRAAERAEAARLAELAFAKETEQSQKKREALQQELAAVEKSVQADKIRAENIEKIAALIGTEAEKAKASAEATEINLQAAQRFNAAQIETLKSAEAELALKDKLIASRINESEKIKKETDELRGKVAKMREETEASGNTVRTLEIEAAQRKLSAEIVKDNSGKLEEYRQRMEDAKRTLAELNEMKSQGLPVDQAVAKATLDLASATRLYGDSLQDTAEKIKLNVNSRQLDFDLTTSGLQLRKAELGATIDLARSIGDEQMERRALIESKQIDVEITRLKAESMAVEARGQIELAETTKTLLESQGQLNEVKKAEIELSIKKAQILLKESEITRQSADALQREADRLQQNTERRNQNSQSSQNIGQSIRRESDVRERNAEMMERENDRIAEQNNLRKMGANYYNSDGWNTDKSGNVINQAVPYVNYAYDAAKQRGLSEEDAVAINEQYWNGGNLWFDKSLGMDWFSQVNKAVNELVVERARERVTAEKVAKSRSAFGTPQGGGGTAGMLGQSNSPTATPTPPLPSPAPAPAPSGGGTRTIRFELGGSSTSVNVASAADGAALEAFVNKLAQSKGISAR